MEIRRTNIENENDKEHCKRGVILSGTNQWKTTKWSRKQTKRPWNHFELSNFIFYFLALLQLVLWINKLAGYIARMDYTIYSLLSAINNKKYSLKLCY